MNLNPLTQAIAIALMSTPIIAVANTQLDQIVVSANNTEQSVRSVTSSYTVITADQIAEKQYQTLSDVLQTVPGMSITGSGGVGKSTQIYLRGNEKKHVLILVDGIDLTDSAGLGGANLQNIQLANIERIEIIKGPQSGVWGANATAGVINIITKKGGKQAAVLFETGSYNTRKLAGTLGDGNEDGDFVFNFNDLSTDGYSAIRAFNRSHNDYEADGYQQTDLSLKLGINPAPGHRFETFIQRSRGSNEFDYDHGSPDDTSYSDQFEQTVRQLQYQFNHQQWQARLYLNENLLERSYTAYNSEYRGTVHDLGAQLGYRYGSQDQLQFSANNKHYIGQSTYLSRTQFTNSGFAVTNTNHFGDDWVLTEALRYDNFDRFENALTGKMGIKKHLGESVYLSANYGTAYSAPTLSQLSRPNLVELVPEKSASYDLSLGAYGLELTYFNHETKDLIEYVPGIYDSNWNEIQPYYYKNSEQKVLTDGVEASYKHSFDAIDTDVSLNFTWLSARNELGEALKDRPTHQANLNLDYYGINKWHWGLETRFIGDRFTIVYGNNDTNGEPYKVQTGNFVVADLTADFEVSPHLMLYGKIINITDDDYFDSVAQATGSNAEYVYSNGGRQFYIGVKGQL